MIARPTFILAIAFVVGLVACSPAPNRSENTSSTAAKTPSASLFRSQPIGDRPRKDERPQMSHVAMVDLDRDGLMDVLACDALRNVLVWLRQSPKGTREALRRGPAGALAEADNFRFTFHRMIDLQGATSPQAADLDGDGDLDVLIVTSNNDWDNPQAPSLLWLENDGHQKFSIPPIASSPTYLLTVAVGDLDGDGKPDAVTGGMHISRPYDRIGRITAWFSTQPGG